MRVGQVADAMRVRAAVAHAAVREAQHAQVRAVPRDRAHGVVAQRVVVEPQRLELGAVATLRRTRCCCDPR